MPNNILITPGSASIEFSGSAANNLKLQVLSNGNVAITGSIGKVAEFSNTGQVFITSSMQATQFTGSFGIIAFVGTASRVNDGAYLSEAQTFTAQKTFSAGIDLANSDITGVNNITISDPGSGEGISWAGGNLWRIYESPNTLTNAAGNLQIVQNTTRRATFNTSGQLEILVATGTAPFAVSSSTLVTNLNADLLDGYNTAIIATPSTVVVRDASGGITGSLFGTSTSTVSASYVAWPNVGLGTRTNYDLDFKPLTSNYAGFRFSKSTSANGAADAGYLLIRGTSDADIYTAEGITLVADAGWLTLAQRTTAARGVRIMTGTTSATRALFYTDGTVEYTGTTFNYSNTNQVLFDHTGNSTPVPFEMRKSGTSITDAESYGILSLTRTNHNNASTSAGSNLYFQLKDSGGTIREYAGIGGRKTVAGADGGALYFYRYGRTVLGYWDANGLYASRFYDYDNSSRYLDPFSTSVINGIDIYGIPTVRAGNDLRFYTSAGSLRGYIQATDTDDNHLIIATSGGEDIVLKDGGLAGDWNMIVRGDGQTLIRTRIDSPIFYDSDNPAYYADPASTSNFNYLNVRGWGLIDTLDINVTAGNWYTIATNSGNRAFATFHIWDTNSGLHHHMKFNAGVHFGSVGGTVLTLMGKSWYSGGGVTRYIRIRGTSTYDTHYLQVYAQYSGTMRIAITDNYQSSAWVLTNGGTGDPGASTFAQIDPNSYSGFNTNKEIYSGTSVTAPIFYDANDPAYYVDPRSASRMSGLRLDGVDNQASGEDAILWINKPNNNDWGIIITGNLDYGADFRMASNATYAVRVLGGGDERWRVRGDGNTIIRNTAPTITFRDTDNRTAFIHVNSNLFYLLSGGADVDHGNWGTVHDGKWPLVINLTNNNAEFGGNVYITANARYFGMNSTGTWGGNTGNGWGKLEYHSNRWYINAGADSTLIAQFRRGGSDQSIINNEGSYTPQTYNKPAILSRSSGTSSAGASFAIQQETGEGWTGIFVDYEPYTGWGFYHDNPNNLFSFTSEGSTGQIRSFTVPSRVSGNRTAYEKFRIDQNNGDFITGRDGYAQGGFYAQAFYDTNNTAYRADPNGTSRFSSTVSDESYTYGWFRNYTSGHGLYNQAQNTHWYSNSPYWKGGAGGNSYGGIVLYQNYESSLRGYLYWDGAGFGLLNSSGNWQLRIEYGNANMELYRTTWGDNLNAYIYRDRDNTGYYLDPNSSSVLWRPEAATMQRWNMHYRAIDSGDHRPNLTGDSNYWTTTHGWGTSFGNWNNMWKYGFAGLDVWGGGTGHPQGGGYIHAQGINSGLHYATGDGGSAYGWQLVGAHDAGSRWWFRGKWGGTTYPWYEVMLYDRNIGGGTFYAGYWADGNNTGYYVDPNGSTQLRTVYADDWFRPQGCTGVYWQSYGRGIWSPECEGNPYGHIATYGGGRNGWYGYGVGSRYTLMSTLGDNFGLHDTARGWIWYMSGAILYLYWASNERMSMQSYGVYVNQGTWASIYYDHDTSFYFDGNGTTSWNWVTDRSKDRIGNTFKYNNPRSNITGDSNYWVGTMGWGTTDFLSMWNWGSGFIDTWGNPANQPAGTSHWVGFQAAHYTCGYNCGYGIQMVGGPISGAWFTSYWSSKRPWYKIAMYGLNEYSGDFYASIMYDSQDTYWIIDPSAQSGNDKSIRVRGNISNTNYANDVYTPPGTISFGRSDYNTYQSYFSLWYAMKFSHSRDPGYWQWSHHIGGCCMFSMMHYQYNTLTLGGESIGWGRTGRVRVTAQQGFEVYSFDNSGEIGDVIRARSQSSTFYSTLFRGYFESWNSGWEKYIMLTTNQGTITHVVYGNGSTYNQTGAYGVWSDISLKQDIIDASPQWNDIKQLRLVKFRLKEEVNALGEAAPHQLGLIAQEVEQISPGLITESDVMEEYEEDEINAQGILTGRKVKRQRKTGQKLKAVKQSILYMKAIKALQEAMIRIETLEEEIKVLKAG